MKAVQGEKHFKHLAGWYVRNDWGTDRLRSANKNFSVRRVPWQEEPWAWSEQDMQEDLRQEVEVWVLEAKQRLGLTTRDELPPITYPSARKFIQERLESFLERYGLISPADETGSRMPLVGQPLYEDSWMLMSPFHRPDEQLNKEILEVVKSLSRKLRVLGQYNHATKSGGRTYQYENERER